MSRSQRSALVVGAGLVFIGVLVLLCQLIPVLHALITIRFSWPLIIVGVGVFLFVLGVFIRVPDMAVPAAILFGIGALLYWQSLTGRWASWSYAWTLIPGFVGLGMILGGLLGGQWRRRLVDGAVLVVFSVIGFTVFGALIEGQSFVLGTYWPVLLILLGGLMLIRPLVKS